tara:strand:- start:146 stop:421 length:276 start_codon:yes stop_codon:yes gene_type:complete
MNNKPFYFATTSVSSTNRVYNKVHYNKLKKLLNEVQVSNENHWEDKDIHLNWVMNTIGELEHDGPLTVKQMRLANDLWSHYTKGTPAPKDI